MAHHYEVGDQVSLAFGYHDQAAVGSYTITRQLPSLVSADPQYRVMGVDAQERVICEAQIDGAAGEPNGNLCNQPFTPHTPHQRIALFGDQAIMLAGLQALVGSVPEAHIVSVSSTMPEALEMARLLSPEVAIVCIGTLRPAGLAFVKRILDEAPLIRILLVCDDRGATAIKAAFRSGVVAYLLKGASREKLLQALRAIARGKLYLDSGLEATPPAFQLPRGSAVSRAPALDDNLTERESQVLRLVVSSLSNKSIAHQTGLSVRSVETYRLRACKKLGLSSRADIMRYGSDRKWAHF